MSFTEHHAFTGPTTAISCEVHYDHDHESYVAESEHGFIGRSRHSADAAALNCFRAWMLGEEGAFIPVEEDG